MRTTRLQVAWLVAALGIAAGTAGAQAPTEAVRRADELFREGRALLDQGKAADACPKFEESQRLDPGLGTLLNLADCYERTDRLASALAAFRSSEEQARSLGEKKREIAAADRARSLEGRVSRVTITVAPGQRPDGFTVKRNGTTVAALDFGRPIAVDPGAVTIEASAPGRQIFATTVQITTARTSPQIDIPELAAEITTAPIGEVIAPPPRTERTVVDPGTGRRRLGYIVGGVGVAGLGAGVVIGLLARSTYKDAYTKYHCTGDDQPVCDPDGVGPLNDAVDQGTLGTIVGGIGVAAIAAGAVLWLTAPSARSVEVAPMVSADGAGVTFAGRF